RAVNKVRFSYGVNGIAVYSTASPQQSKSGIFPSAALWLTIPRGEVSRPQSHHSIYARRRFQRDGEAAGGYRPHHRRLHQAEEGGRAELFRALSVSWGEDGVVLGACHAAVLS